MISTTFSSLLADLSTQQAEEKQQKSFEWFMGNAKKIRTFTTETQQKIDQAQAVIDPGTLKLSGKALPDAISGPSSIIGKLLFFQYIPKGKDTLPYWDEYPMIFPINIYSDGYLGLNLHYLPIPYRAKLMDSLYTLIINEDKMDETTRLRISYNILENYEMIRYFQPCVKRYLYSHVRSQWSVIPPKEWDAALFLPLQKFHKASDMHVWSQSIKRIY